MGCHIEEEEQWSDSGSGVFAQEEVPSHDEEPGAFAGLAF